MYNIMTMLLTQLKTVILFVLFGLAMSNQIYTKTQLRGFHQKMINEAFEEKIEEIIKTVIQYANNNKTSYEQIICLNDNHFEHYDYTIFNKKSDDTLIQRLQDTLIDSNITITEHSYRWCNEKYNADETKINSRKLIINW